jgi:hypothetical protein
MIKLKIDVTKIDKTRLFKGAKGTYLDLVVYENDTPDEYGNDFSVKQDCTREDREAGVKMPYIGNGKNMGQKKPSTTAPRKVASAAVVEDDDQEIPF